MKGLNYKHLGIILVLGWGQVQAKGTVQEEKSIELIEQASEKSDQFYAYLVAAYQHCTGKIAEAKKTFQRLFKQNPSIYAYNGYLTLLFDLTEFKQITDLYEAKNAEFTEAFESDVEMQLIWAQSYLNLNKDDKAEGIFMHLHATHPDNEQVAYFSTMAYIKNNQLGKALEFIEKCLKNTALKQKHYLFYFLKSKILVQQNKLPQALAVIEKSLQLFPKFERGWLLKAVLMEQMGKINDAINGYKHFLDMVGRDVTVEKQLIQLLFSQKRFNEALAYMKKIKTNTPEYYFDMALVEFRNNNFNAALKHLDQAIGQAPTFTKARLLKIEILLQTKKISDLLTFMQSWILHDVQDTNVIHTVLLLRKTNLVPVPSLIKTLQQVCNKNPHVNVLAALADLQVANKEYPQAIQTYQKLIAQTQDNALKSKTLFQMGYVHMIANQHDDAERVLKDAVKLDQVYPSAYNLLAYHYAKMNKNLPEALDLVNKALDKNPTCYYYLDTKGYVLFKQGKKDEAITTFKEALQQAPEDSIIKNHLKTAQEGTL